MRHLILAAMLAGSLAGGAQAEPPVCNEPWAVPDHSPVHPPPCHEPPDDCEESAACDPAGYFQRLLQGSD